LQRAGCGAPPQRLSGASAFSSTTGEESAP
jgi:hypothetical protein